MFGTSIRWRLQVWLGFLLVCVLSGFVATVHQLQRVNRFAQIDEELQLHLSTLMNAVRRSPPFGLGPGRPPFEFPSGREEADGGARPSGPRWRPEPPPPGAPWEFRGGPRDLRFSAHDALLLDEARIGGVYFVVWTGSGEVLRRSTNAPVQVPRPERAGRDTLTHARMREAFRETYQFNGLGDCVLVGRSITADLAGLRRFAWGSLAAGGAVLVLGLGGGWWLTSRALRPIEEISAAASRISAGNLSERITAGDPGNGNELDRLAGVLNSTFARLEAAFAQQKQFTADASHELRTPLAVIISEAQTTLARERNASEYRETVQVCLDAAQQMRRLTQSLLELARFDAGQEPLGRSPVDLAEQVRVCIERVRPLAKERGLDIQSELDRVEVNGDIDRLGQVITNLLINAIQYNKPGGSLRVGVRNQGGTAVLTVTDTGPGIAPEDLPRVFERFYRADKSRTGSEGRSGLGLAICKAILDGHGASIAVSSERGVGTTFTVRFPG